MDSISHSEIIGEAQQRNLEQQGASMTRRMRFLSQEQRSEVMAAAAEALHGYYRTDPEVQEVQEWQALDSEDFYDLEDAQL